MSNDRKSSKTLNLITSPLLAGAIAVMALSAVNAQAAIFLKLDGVPGESTSSGHKDEIDVVSFQFGLNADNTLSPSGGATRDSSPTCEGVVITKALDKSSPVLAGAVMTGKTMKKGTFTFTRNDGESDAIFYSVIMTDVLVTSVAQSGRGNELPHESVSFIARQIELKYRSQSADGKLGPEVRATLDCSRGARS